MDEKNIIEQWIKESVNVVGEEQENTLIASHFELDTNDNKKGLGYDQPKKLKSSKKTKERIKSLEKNAKNNEHDNEDDDNELLAVDFKLETSRTSIGNALKSRRLNSNQSTPQVNQSTPTVNIPTPKIVESSSIQKQHNDQVSTNHNKSDLPIRKRTKTRSKQKNIRKDNRPNEKKPSHLQLNNAEGYRGRSLTQETRESIYHKNKQSPAP